LLTICTASSRAVELFGSGGLLGQKDGTITRFRAESSASARIH
jgi:hypothetical protein